MFRKLSALYLTNYKALSATTILVRNYTPRRALMYVPGDDIKKVNKAFTLDVDCIALDCEDGVASNSKDNARTIIREVLNKGKPERPRKYDLGIRVNSVDSGLCHDDLKHCLTAVNLPDTILLPKVESAEHLKWFTDILNKLIVTDKKVDLIFYIESAVGFINMVDICKTAEQLSKSSKFMPTTLVFGSDDFCANIGATRTEDSSEILYARQKLVLTAKAFHLQAIDMVYIKYKDLDGLKAQCAQGMRMGYTGKQVIHPGQVPIVQESFLPNKNQVKWAEGIIKSFDEHQKTGKGAFTYEGSMIDMPTVRQAQNILELMKLSY